MLRPIPGLARAFALSLLWLRLAVGLGALACCLSCLCLAFVFCFSFVFFQSLRSVLCAFVRSLGLPRCPFWKTKGAPQMKCVIAALQVFTGHAARGSQNPQDLQL